mmetsp:Transcript_5902/g.8958  ORF Transcript_5902/g.8958 Transcript_5902/m.8958 type:complete len:85 (+) Transcript_5902:2062-2316(+)
MSAPRSGRSTPLARKAITNRAMSLSSPTEEDVPSAESSSSPMRPETLVFEDDASSQCASPLVKMPEQENDDYIPPPPSSHPPSP